MPIDGGLRKIFQAYLQTWHWTSIETGGTGRGVPDSYFCARGISGWIEYKLAHGYVVNLRPEQIAWIEQHLRHGGRAYIAVRRQSSTRGKHVDELHLYHGSTARQLLQRQATLRVNTARRLGCWHGGPARWSWDEIAKFLKS